MKPVLVLAHFDVDGRLDAHVRRTLAVAAPMFARTILASGNLAPGEEAELDSSVSVLRRPNRGYDFGAWRDAILGPVQHADPDRLVLLNDSTYVLKPDVFRSILARGLSCEADVWGLTASQQFQPHLQTYLLGFSRRALRSAWFQRFWRSRPDFASRDEAVVSGELTLTAEAEAAGMRVRPLLVLKPEDVELARRRCARHEQYQPAERPVPNPTLHLWERTLDETGLLKGELLRDNPLGLDLSALDALCDPTALADARAHCARVSERHRAARLAPVDAPALDDVPDQPRASVAIALHLYHLELWPEFQALLARIPVPLDIFVSMPSAESFIRFRRMETLPGVVPYVQPNRGRDMGPFMALLNSGRLDGYGVICKLHSKKSSYSAQGDRWRQELVSRLIGSSRLALETLSAFESRPRLGMVGPHGNFLVHDRFWGANRGRVEDLARRMGWTAPEVPLAFFAGSMWWASPAALMPLKRLNLTASDFEDEAGQQDGTLAHAIERLAWLSVATAGFDAAASDDLAGTVIPDARFVASTVPVL